MKLTRNCLAVASILVSAAFKYAFETANPLLHTRLFTVVGREITTLVPLPLVITTSLPGPGVACPAQFCALAQEAPSPLPFQMTVWAGQ